MARPLSGPVAAAVTVAVAAVALYTSTLLPGFDFGDTPSFQVMAGSASITPRDGYPLFFAIGSLFTWFTPDDPAHAMNLASAAAAGVACGLIVLLAADLSGSWPAAAAAAVAFGGSYTFWSQSVIAEVYALHIGLVAGILLLLLRWERRPTTGRLAMFFAVYALAFGNHLSTILLLPACALFLVLAAPGGWRTMVAPRTVALAVVIAAAGSLQYLWNIHTLWRLPQAPASVMEGMSRFWFDVTKSDWRDTMVLEVPDSMILERLAMYRFDVVQQFGWILPAVAAVGLYRLVRENWKHAVLVGGIYAANVLFALSYSVGDSHVFFLPSHLMIALFIAPGVVLLGRTARGRATVALLLLTVSGVRIFHDYPALDRSDDRRPRQVLDALTLGLDDRNAVILTDQNWQVQNGLTYYAKNVHRDLATARMPDVLLYAPALIQDNLAIRRNIVVTTPAADELTASYGGLFSFSADSRAPERSLSDAIGALAKGTRYVLCVLAPTRDFAIDAGDLARVLAVLTGGRTSTLPRRQYVAVAGVVGDDATVIAGDRPFRQWIRLDGVPVDLRMESWLAFDTIRRMGFGQVVAGRRHTLIVERGVSFAAFDAGGRAIVTEYRANIFAPQPRWLVAGR